MAETEQIDGQPPEEGDCATTFEWNENVQLYFHSSTGFYYSPTGDWYYSSRDGLYYKFENGNYVLDTAIDESKVNSRGEGIGSSHLVEGQQCNIAASEKDGQFVAEMSGPVIPNPDAADLECLENRHIEEPSPPSEWLEDTLIELFLSGYPSQSAFEEDVLPTESYNVNTLDTVANGDPGNYEVEDGEWISEENNGLIVPNRNDADQGTSWEEENWKAQYGQVSEPNEVSVSAFNFLDLWDWELVPTEYGKSHGARLAGRLVKRSSKLHPSLQSGGTRLKTSPICQVLADLVRVKSGQIYKLRRPSKCYLKSLSVYDSCNPTSGWGYPELSVSAETQTFSKLDGHSVHMEAAIASTHTCEASNKDKSTAYRDRAAERRAFHGGFGLGPGQKKSHDAESSPSATGANLEAAAAAAESLNMSFGSGSYARRLLENMGWKEGEALGRSSTNGLLEPLQANGNNGHAGLGWNEGKRKVLYSTCK